MKVVSTRRIPTNFYDANVEYWNAISDDDSLASSVSEIVGEYTTEDVDNHSQESENEFKEYDKFRQAYSQRRKTKEELNNSRRHIVVPESDTDDAIMPERISRKQRRPKPSRLKSAEDFAPLPDNAPTLSEIPAEKARRRSWTDSGVSLSRTDQSRSSTLFEERLSNHSPMRASPAIVKRDAVKDMKFRPAAANNHVEIFGYDLRQPSTPCSVGHAISNPASRKTSRTEEERKEISSQLQSNFDEMSNSNVKTTRLLSRISKLLDTSSNSDSTSLGSTSPGFHSISQESKASIPKHRSPVERRASKASQASSIKNLHPAPATDSGKSTGNDDRSAGVFPLSSISLTHLRRSSIAESSPSSSDRQRCESESGKRPLSRQMALAGSNTALPTQSQPSAHTNGKAALLKGSQSHAKRSSVGKTYDDRPTAEATKNSNKLEYDLEVKTRSKGRQTQRPSSDTELNSMIETLMSYDEREMSLAKQNQIMSYVMDVARKEALPEKASPSPYPKQTDYTINRYLANHNQDRGLQRKSSGLMNGLRRVSSALIGTRFFSQKQPKDCATDFSFIKIERPEGHKASPDRPCGGNSGQTETVDTCSVSTDETVREEKCSSSKGGKAKKMEQKLNNNKNATLTTAVEVERQNECQLEKLGHKPSKAGIISRLFRRSRSYSAERLVSKEREKAAQHFSRPRLNRASTHSMPDNVDKHSESSESRHLRSKSLGDLRKVQDANRSKPKEECQKPGASQVAQPIRRDSRGESEHNLAEDSHSTRGKHVSRSMTDLDGVHDYELMEDLSQRKRTRVFSNGRITTSAARFNPNELLSYGVNDMDSCLCHECLYEEYLQFVQFRQSLRQVPFTPCHRMKSDHIPFKRVSSISSEILLAPKEASPIYKHSGPARLVRKGSAVDLAPSNQCIRKQQNSTAVGEYPNPSYQGCSFGELPRPPRPGSCSSFGGNASRQLTTSTDAYHAPLPVQGALEKQATTVKISPYDTYV